jgi:hypothetical protein
MAVSAVRILAFKHWIPKFSINESRRMKDRYAKLLAYRIMRRGFDGLLVYPGGEILEAVPDATPRIANVAWTGPMLPPAFQGPWFDVQKIGGLGLCEQRLFDWERRRAGVI